MDLERLSSAVHNDDSATIEELLGRQRLNVVSNEPEAVTIEFSQESFFKMAVKEFKTEWIQYFLKQIIKKSIPCCSGAQMIKDNFKDLWIDYWISIEPMMKKDVLGWDVCTISVPLETFTKESNIGTRVGTCNTIVEWIQSSREGTSVEHWKQLNEEGVKELLKTSRGRMVNAIVRIFCFADVCRTGSDGIIRFLLMHKAPSSIFKAPLIRWVIVYKWERIWKRHAFKSLAYYLAFLIVFNVPLFVYSQGWLQSYSIMVTYTVAITVGILTVILAILTLWREFFQLKRYIQDGRKMFPSSDLKGMRYYFNSRQNQIDLTLSLSTLALLILICNGIYTKLVSSTIAFTVLLLWAKAIYHVQAFKRTGLFVLMINKVLRECLPYFVMLFGFMVGFGFTMYMALLDFYSEIEWGGDPYNWKHDFCSTYSYYDYDAWRVSPRSYYCRLLNCHHYSNDCPDVTEIQWDKIDLLQFIQHWFIPDMFRFQYNAASKVEDLDDIKKSFGTPLRSILTMAYAMVGLFDPKVLLECGYATWLVIPIFVLYLALQTIVMFNLLIAAMGDAFDGVRASEEESFLMTRAEAIDQFEASLGNIGINAIEEKIGKYLYVLVLEDKQLEKSVPFWKGRMRTIKEDVRKIVLDSHEEMTQKIDQQSERIDQQGQNINQLNEKMDSLAQKMDLLTENMNGMFKILKDDIRSMDGRIKTLEK